MNSSLTLKMQVCEACVWVRVRNEAKVEDQNINRIMVKGRVHFSNQKP